MKNINKNFSNRMRLVMDERGLEIRDVSAATKISYEMVRRYVHEGAVPRSSNLEKIAKLLNVEQSWLVFGSDNNCNMHDNIYKKNNSFFIEHLDVTASAGVGYLNSDVMEVIKLIEYNSDQAKDLFNGVNANDLKLINISGDSMRGTFESGDTVYVDVSRRAFDGDGIYVFSFGRGLYIKRLQLIKDRLIVISDNKLYKEWDIGEDEVDQLYIHGKVMLSQSMLLRKHG
jgi:phage repressor protein C with HTH and peptisase S24 domain